MPEYQDLVTVVGRVMVGPKRKDTPKGDVIEFKVSQRRSYSGGVPDANGNDWGKSRLVSVAIWNEHLAEKVEGEIIKGMTVAVIGALKRQDDQFADVQAFEVGHVAMIAKNGTKAKQPDDDLGF